MDHWLTYTYKNISEFDVRYNQDHETGAVFRYTYQAPVVIEEKPSVEPEEPEKPLAPQDPQEPQEPQEPKADETTEKEAPKKTAPAPVLTSVAIKEKTKLVYTTQQPILTSTAVALKAKTTEVHQPTLPQTNEKKASIFTTLGGACLVLLSGLFIVKRKSNEE
nr:LPXTG cell wall anchor domain-containing protein [Enterococcus raffinosus]